MISAFGVEHTVSKGLSRNQLKGLLAVKNARGTGREQYAAARYQAHRIGRQNALGSKTVGGNLKKIGRMTMASAQGRGRKLP